MKTGCVCVPSEEEAEEEECATGYLMCFMCVHFRWHCFKASFEYECRRRVRKKRNVLALKRNCLVFNLSFMLIVFI